MQRWILNLTVLLSVQAAAAIALGVHTDRLAPARPGTLLVSADLKDIDTFAVDGPVSPDEDKSKAEKIELVKRDGRWLLPTDYDAPANAEKIQDLVKKLSALTRGLPIATTEAALKRFDVAEDKYERRLVASMANKPVVTLYLGSSPGPRQTNARTSADKAVYAVDLSTFDLPTGKTDWLDQTLLKREANTLSQIKIVAADQIPITLQRSTQPANQAGAPPSWAVHGLAQDRQLDEEHASTLVDTISRLRVDAVLGVEPKPEWQLDQPQLRLTLKDTNSKVVTWVLSKPADGDTHVLKATDQPWYLELKSWNAQPLIDAAAYNKLVVVKSAVDPAQQAASVLSQ